ncbi:MAG: hypothetical protein RL204_75 [Bacteroidota bacterium]|jgi:molybdopterin-guanine dinucleotide biosynthesis protein A
MSHGKTDKVKLGNFCRNEVAFYGTTCNAIEQLYGFLNHVHTTYQLVYIDGDHQDKTEERSSRLVVGLEEVSLKANRNWSRFDYAISTNEYDLAIVNGNHFQASSQIVVCDKSKQGSLERRINELTNVKAIVNFDSEDIPDFVKTCVPNFSVLPQIKSTEELALWIQRTYLMPPALEALVLAGGKSSRMGQDKSQIEYHGIPHWQYLSLCVEDLGLPLNISCREDQIQNFQRKGANLISDKVHAMGPIGGLISAFMCDSSKAYLTIASDLPNVNSAFLFELISQRDPSKFATAFINSEKGWPEPLITIWEPRSFLRIMQFVGLGNTCPRKVLMNSPVKLIEPSDQQFLLNVNNPEERDRVLFSK